jgi:CBS domain-containing protein
MFEQPIGELMDPDKLLLGPPSMTVSQAAGEMQRRAVGAVLVVDAGRLLGIFTERDAVYRVIAAGLDVQSTPIGAVMTPQPRSLGPDERYGLALLLMREHGFRHVPVVADGKVLGIVSSRLALDPEMEDFVAEAHRRDSFEQRAR